MRKTLSFLPVFLVAACAKGPGPIVPDTRTERQMIGLLQKFDRWDLDGNGELNLNELKPAAAASGKSRQEILAFYDVDRNGAVTLVEAQRGLERKVDEHDKGNHAPE